MDKHGHLSLVGLTLAKDLLNDGLITAAVIAIIDCYGLLHDRTIPPHPSAAACRHQTASARKVIRKVSSAPLNPA